MIGRALNKDYDIYWSGGRSAFVEGDDQVRQNIEARFKFFMGEWFLDLEAGTPWYQSIFVKPFNVKGTEAILKERILTTKEVNQLLSFTTDYTSIGNGVLPPRGYSLTASCDTINGTKITNIKLNI